MCATPKNSQSVLSKQLEQQTSYLQAINENLLHLEYMADAFCGKEPTLEEAEGNCGKGYEENTLGEINRITDAMGQISTRVLELSQRFERNMAR